MAGFREFVTGEVLTAANVDDFLAKQAVMKFADAAARDSALGTAVAGGNALREGMVAWIDDDDELLAYDGSDWVGVGGGLVAVKSAIFTGTMATAVGTDGGTFAVTDLSITHALADASNKLIISAYFGSASDSEGKARVGLAVNDGTNFIGIGAADGTRTRIGAGGLVSETAGTLVTTMPSVTFVHAPGDTSSRTYTVHAVALSAATVYINRTEVDNNDPSRQRAASAFVIQEVKV